MSELKESEVSALRRACECLFIQVPEEVARDVKAKAEAVIALAEASTPIHAAELLRRCDEQDKQWGGAEHDDSHDELDWESFIQKQIDQARMSDSSNGWRGRMVDIGALALAAIKWADRKDEQQK